MSEFKDALRLPGFSDLIDISQAQRIESADAVREAGFVGAYAKASEGVAHCDPRVREFLDRLGDAGLYTSVYTFLRVQLGDPWAQVDKAFSCAGDVYQTRLLLDLETHAGRDPVQLCDFLEACLDRVAHHGHGGATLYTYTSFLQERLRPEVYKRPRLIALPLHLAQYYSLTRPVAPTASSDLRRDTAPWDDWTLLQYSGNNGYRVPGIVGDCDRNLFRGDETSLRRYFGLPTEGEGEPGFRAVHGTAVVDWALEQRPIGGPFSES